jgi:hypothetical protein
MRNYRPTGSLVAHHAFFRGYQIAVNERQLPGVSSQFTSGRSWPTAAGGDLSSQALVIVTAYSSTWGPLLHGRPSPRRSHHSPVRVLPHVKRLDDALGDFLVRASLARVPAYCLSNTVTAPV